MWQTATYPIILGSLGVVLITSRALRGDWPSLVVILMIWVRFAMAALGQTAVDTSVAGFSLIALSTLAMTGLGILMVPLDLYRSRLVLPFYVLVSFGILSGILNGSGVEIVTYFILWSFFLVCFLLLYRAYLIHGHRQVLLCLIAAFSLPLGMQLLSVVLNNPKVGMDGSLSYIGGYVHEAVYAVILLAALWSAIEYPWRRESLKWAAVIFVLAALYMANYRTIIIASAPILIVFILQYSNSDRRSTRRLAALLVVVALAVSQMFYSLAGERYEEIGTATEQIGHIFKPPEEFTARDKDILSSRMFIWSSYLHGTLNSDLPQLLVGHGPESRPPGMTVHAHNEYLRILFESGLVGFALWIWIFAQQFSVAMRALPQGSGMAAAAGYLAIMLGALGTSFFNRPEGMILFAILCSTNWYQANPRPVSRRNSGSLRFDAHR